MILNKILLLIKCVGISSYINEAINTTLNFFIQKFHNHKKAQKAYKRIKIKKCSSKSSKGKIVTYSLICVLCFLPYAG